MLNWITNIISSLGYVGIALLMFLENLFPPIPSELIMPLAGFTVTQSKLNLQAVILAGTLGSVLGALPWYYIGKLVSEERLRNWINKHGKWLTLSTSDIDKSKRWMRKYGKAVIFFGRLVPGIRTFISVPAGLDKMPLIPFILYSFGGSLLWTAILTYAGFILGNNFQLVEKYVGLLSGIIIAAIILFLIISFIRRKSRQN
ncbi:DedA family protein [Plectonema cf. radiosum LEGE 06105]|uniref:DedA family protein n=1 Tax=Plectonema cf. radiosum LEGE 06105 TaxID=945769 RepID=A0A8J7F9W2_9CYAN|nr:DedA family protein [Plectonema radiosum]MBE9212288.1 DedA family protein [Plectonema cf. radiosum LEGE 06105]